MKILIEEACWAHLNVAATEYLGWEEISKDCKRGVGCTVHNYHAKNGKRVWNGLFLPATELLDARWLLNRFVNGDNGTTSVDISGLYPGSGDAPFWEVMLNKDEKSIGVGETIQEAITRAILLYNGITEVEVPDVE